MLNKLFFKHALKFVDGRNRLVLLIYLAVVFLFSFITIWCARELVLPRVYPIIDGNISGDAYLYHSIALRKSEEIRSCGLNCFEFFPMGQGAAGLLSLLYLFSKTPWVVIVLNATLHTASVLVAFLILRIFFSFGVALISTAPLVVSAYMLPLWYSQINKDSFALYGGLLFVLGVIKFFELRDFSFKKIIVASGILTASSVFVWFARPYLNVIFPVLLFIIAMVVLMTRQSVWQKLAICASFLIVCSLMGSLNSGSASDVTINNFVISKRSTNIMKRDLQMAQSVQETVSIRCLENISNDAWEDSPYLPRQVNSRLKALMGIRCLTFKLLENQKNPVVLKSIIDIETLPNGSHEALAYAPRAFANSVFLPWPTQWRFINSEAPSWFLVIAPFETALLYIGLVSLVIWSIHNRVLLVLAPVGVSVAIIFAYGLSTPFLGSLYRYRYPWWMFLICLGCGAALELLKEWRRADVK